MKSIKTLLLILLFSKCLYAQNDTIEDSKRIFSFVEQMPYYKGGEEALTKFLRKKMDYSKKCSSTGLLHYQITIMKDSTVGAFKIMSGSSNCELYVGELLKQTNQWIAGQQNKLVCNVNIYVTIDIGPKYIQAFIPKIKLGNKNDE